MKQNSPNLQAESELHKDSVQQINDLIEEANRLIQPPNIADSEENNLDRIKHLLKRIGFQQAAIDYKTSKTNKILIVLTGVAIIPAIETIVKFFEFIFNN